MTEKKECRRCRCACHNPRQHMGAAEFKKLFKVGDKAKGWSTDKLIVITAIGVTRFLYTEPNSRHPDKERISNFYATTWEKVP